MKQYTLTTELWLPQRRDIVFPFFADARNLETITPPLLRFKIVTPCPVDMHVGTRIDYRLRLHGIPLRWQSEISVWDPPYRFVDEQRRGPYRLWIHTHEFEDRDNGTLCRDHVVYAVPGGRFVNWLLVRRDVERIFEYRQVALRRQFPAAIEC